MRRVLGSLVVALTLGSAWAVVVAHPAAAQSSETIRSYDVDLTVQPNGDLSVVETIVYDFGAEQRHGIYREIPTRLHYDDTYDRVFPLHVDSVSGSPGTPVGYTTEDAGDGKTGIKIGDPDQLITGVHEYAIAYTVQGALNAFPNRDELYWNAIGDEWSVTIQRASVRVSDAGTDHGGRLLPRTGRVDRRVPGVGVPGRAPPGSLNRRSFRARASPWSSASRRARRPCNRRSSRNGGARRARSRSLR